MLSVVTFRGSSYSVRGLIVMLASTLLLISISSDFSFANLNTYVISYMRRTNEDLTYADWIFVAQTKPLLIGLFCWVGGVSAQKIGLRATLIIGSVAHSAGFAFCYFAVDIGLWAVVLGISVCGAIGYSMIYTTTLSATLKWFPGKAVMASVALAGYGYGSVIWNPLQTAFVNPYNVAAEEVPGETDRYFLDPDLLDRVPDMFLLLAGIFVAMQVLSVFFVREPTDEEAAELAALNSKADNEKKEEKEKALKDRFSASPNEALKTGAFWIMWYGFFSMALMINFINNYQKSYAQIYIPDDKFLALVATVQNVMNGTSRIFGGLFYDSIGYKKTVFILACFSAIFTFLLPALQLFEGNIFGAKIFYTICTTCIYCSLPGVFAPFPAEAMRIFGPVNNAAIFGLILSCCIATSVSLTIYTQTAFDTFGYVWTFIILGVVATTGAAVTYAYPNKISDEDMRKRFQPVQDLELTKI